ncbi:PAS domain-containing protein [Denitromonas ohlonensis]|uniref:PAS domain-containing protein n=2 Tax=Denitromonas TaxID=139331 RepID=A0A557RLF4_9RHOO|nr:PAS domain-containing protein [Denitromonas ohlonensis]TVO66010.1 PAS domain-containing protein [Denitromonas ohlonensis]TVO79603.1 PAS domain-containing protein [Denitromonas ohlonensis]
MKRAITPTQVERVMRDDDFIVSKTNPKGIITYCNPIFVEFSGYTEDELLGVQHNIIRHPDMPRAAFKLVWDTIATGKEVFAYVKNLSKDGGFYWVLAHITPDVDTHGRITGYTSVRRCPTRPAVEAVSAVYAQMLQAEKQAGARDAIAAGTQVLVDVMKAKDMRYEELVFAL